MSNSHGDLFTEIGRLVLAANSGQAIDLGETAKDLAERYKNLGMTEDTLTKVVSRSIGAISYSMARANGGLQSRLEALHESETELAPSELNPDAVKEDEPAGIATTKQAKGVNRARRSQKKTKTAQTKSDAKTGAGNGKSPFPSGVKLAVLT